MLVYHKASYCTVTTCIRDSLYLYGECVANRLPSYDLFFRCVTDAQLTLVPTCLLMCASLTKNTDSTIHITLTHFQTRNRVISPYNLTAATNHDSKSIHIASIYHTVLSHSYRYLMNRTRNRGRARGPVGFDAPINMGSAKCEIEWNSIFQGKYLTDY